MGGGGGSPLEGSARPDRQLHLRGHGFLVGASEPDHLTNWRRRYHHVLRPVQHAHLTRVAPFLTARSALGARRRGSVLSKLTLPSHRSAATPTATSWPSPGCSPARPTGSPSPAGQPGSASWTSPGCRRSTVAKYLRLLRDAGLLGIVESGTTPQFRSFLHATTVTAPRCTSCAFPLTLRFPLWRKLGPLLGSPKESWSTPPHAREEPGEHLAPTREVQRRAPVLSEISDRHLRSVLRPWWAGRMDRLRRAVVPRPHTRRRALAAHRPRPPCPRVGPLPARGVGRSGVPEPGAGRLARGAPGGASRAQDRMCIRTGRGRHSRHPAAACGAWPASCCAPAPPRPPASSTGGRSARHHCEG